MYNGSYICDNLRLTKCCVAGGNGTNGVRNEDFEHIELIFQQVSTKRVGFIWH